MLESIIPATTVIDKPEIGVTSTESSISCIECDRDVEDEPHFLTIQDYVESKLGARDRYSEQDYINCNVPIISGCKRCYATLGPWSACPTNTGYIYCTDCVTPAIGFLTLADFEAFEENW